MSLRMQRERYASDFLLSIFSFTPELSLQPGWFSRRGGEMFSNQVSYTSGWSVNSSVRKIGESQFLVSAEIVTVKKTAGILN